MELGGMPGRSEEPLRGEDLHCSILLPGAPSVAVMSDSLWDSDLQIKGDLVGMGEGDWLGVRGACSV